MSLQANVHFYDHPPQDFIPSKDDSFCVGGTSYIDVSYAVQTATSSTYY